MTKLDSLMSEGLTAPRGAPVAYALVFETKSDPNGTFPLHLTLSAVRTGYFIGKSPLERASLCYPFSIVSIRTPGIAKRC
ncbi:hypothetical protein DVQ18_14960 [Yersinia enterocolitica]|nr:hypothetical protein [Yersinia enterocolitica]EKN5121711.1 hypothetical protein [Yersinia enterocolitica]EKN5137765.1 hypothetical protein [Yersinia enterocolitica]EKN5145406.1 hypothetical protein [Yersinia enterocolitica]EKN6105288.1 hypothetical protein [Yersinia enterocolitica]